MDDNTTTLLKRTEDGRYKKTDVISEADYVRVPIGEYVPLTEWNDLIDEYELLKDQYSKLVQLDKFKSAKLSEDTVTILKAEYHGLQKALRIVRDRSLQQIDKEKADSQGYTFKYCDERVYDRAYPDQKAYLITKTTPVSLKMDLETAEYLIKRDLIDFYHFIDISAIRVPDYPDVLKITAHDLILACSQRNNEKYSNDFYVDNSDKGRLIKAFLDIAPQALTFDLARIIANLGQGVYDISYWSTGPI